MFARFSRLNVGKTFTQMRNFVNYSNPMARENMPIYGTMVGIAALTFQVTVLYPWHKELSDQFIEIEVSSCLMTMEMIEFEVIVNSVPLECDQETA